MNRAHVVSRSSIFCPALTGPEFIGSFGSIYEISIIGIVMVCLTGYTQCAGHIILGDVLSISGAIDRKSSYKETSKYSGAGRIGVVCFEFSCGLEIVLIFIFRSCI